MSKLEALGLSREDVLALLGVDTEQGETTQARQMGGSSARRIQPAVRKSTTVVLEADQTVAIEKQKAVKPDLVIPKSAEMTEYDGKTIVLRKIGKTGKNADGTPWASDYVEFSGFKSINGDFKLNMRTARMLADENVQIALAAFMAKIPS